MHPRLPFGISELVSFATWWQQVPTQSTVSNCTFQNHYRCICCITNSVPNPNFDSDIPTDGHPLVIKLAHPPRTTAHHADVANIATDGPVTLVVNQIGIQFFFFDGGFKRSIPTFDLSKIEHIGLAHQDVNLHWFGHVSRLALSCCCSFSLGGRANGNGRTNRK